MAHTRFGCTAPTGNRVMALCYFQIYIVRQLSVQTYILVMDSQILLSFHRNMKLHMRMAHTRFGCTAPTGNRVMDLFYFQICIVDRQTKDIERDIVLALSVRPFSFRPSGRL